MRSLLYVPADKPRFIAKAHERGADCVILDLEDAVAEANKALARDGLADAVASLRQGRAQVAVRINPGHYPDVAAAVAAGPDLVVLPKVESPDDIAALDGQLRTAGAPEAIMVIGIVESPAGVLAAQAIAYHDRIMALITGSEDLALALGAVPDPDVLRLPKLLVHYAAKAAGKLSLGLMRSIADYADLDGVREAASEARRHGFDGATCVHPSAIALLNAAFMPSQDDIAWAQGVIENAGAGRYDGQMLDRPVLARARAILAQIRE